MPESQAISVCHSSPPTTWVNDAQIAEARRLFAIGWGVPRISKTLNVRQGYVAGRRKTEGWKRDQIESLPGELWKPVAISDTGYQVSNLGRILGPKGRMPSCYICANGYRSLRLQAGGEVKHFKVHRLVISAFGPEPTEGRNCVNHIDGNKLNNRWDNLEWVTILENIRHAWETGLCHGKKGSAHHMSKLLESDVVEIRRQHASLVKIAAIAKQFKIDRKTVWQIVHRVKWTHVA